VVHGGLDGYSRYVTYLRSPTNNRSSTVLNLFLQSVDKYNRLINYRYGIPNRVRGDLGTENVLVCQFMENTMGDNRGSYIGGRSVHNQRIERLWRDLFSTTRSKYYNLFSHLEEQNLLNIEDNMHLACYTKTTWD
jgi:hypothetical protein